MRINDLLTKPTWKRRDPPKKMTKRGRSQSVSSVLSLDSPNYSYMTQADFMEELEPTAHKINSTEIRSMRPIYKWNETTNKKELVEFEDVERVAIGIQDGIRRHKVTHTFGNELEFRNVGDSEDGDRIKEMLSQWDMTGMKDALMMWARGFFGCGDSALYLYREDDRIKYKVFSFESDDLINQKGDKFIRLFSVEGKRIIEVYDKRNISIWVEESNVADSAFLLNIGISSIVITEKSEDGWICISRVSHGLTQNPVIYHREKDVCWGKGQNLIDRLEKILSDLAENNRYYAFQILFLTGGVINLPDVKFQGKVMASKTKDGKAEILQPANASDSFTLDLNKTLEMLWESTGTTVINIEDLKGGDQSGAYIINLYFRAVQWSTEKIAELRPVLGRVVSVFSEQCGLINRDTSGYRNMRISWSLFPMVPRNKMEEITMIGMQVGAGIMSRETASEISPDTSVDELQRLKREKEEPIPESAAPDGVGVIPGVEIKHNIDNKVKTKKT